MISHLRQRLRQNAQRLLPLLLLAAGGAALLPLTRHISSNQLARGLRTPLPAIRNEDAISQQIALFCLGGLRSLAAEILALDATDAWVASDWPRALRRWETITTLSPQRVNYWIRAAQDMARNAASQIRVDRTLSRHQQAVLADTYAKRGERFLLDGIANNPDSYRLYLELARYYADIALPYRYADAAAAYNKAIELGAPAYHERWVLYNLCKVRTRVQESWQLAYRLYQNPDNRTPSLLGILFALQHKAQVPPHQQLSAETLFGSKEQAIRQLRHYLNNDLHYPTYGISEWLQAHSPAPQSPPHPAPSQ